MDHDLNRAIAEKYPGTSRWEVEVDIAFQHVFNVTPRKKYEKMRQWLCNGME